MLVYLATESRLTFSRRAMSRPETPWESSLLISSTTVMGTAIFFRVPYLLALPLVNRVGKRRGGTYLTVAGPVTVGFRSRPGMGRGPGHLG